MIRPLRTPTLFVPWLLTLAAVHDVAAQTEPGESTATRPIPGITAPDPFPNGCVDCHVVYPDRDLDVRISTLMARWEVGVEGRLLDLSRALAPADLQLEGRHPDATEALDDIPEGCLRCHRRRSRRAPPLAMLLHAIHLAGGSENHFLSTFQGECTYCHKLDAATGRWSMPSGPEPESEAGGESGAGAAVPPNSP